jgi:hypothetical protein
VTLVPGEHCGQESFYRLQKLYRNCQKNISWW